MLKITKLLVYSGFFVTFLAVALKVFYSELLGTMESPGTAQQAELGLQGYGADGGIVIGLDLGESCSRVGIFRGEDFELIPDTQGRVKTPSYVSFWGGQILVGEEAKALARYNSMGTVHNIRNLIGRHSNDQQFFPHSKQPSLKTIVQKDGFLAIEISTNENLPQIVPAHQILSELIKKLKNDAELYLDQPVKHAIVSVPASFGDRQREYMKKAGSLAGLEILRVINEPTAAGIANATEVDLFTSDEGKVLSLDFNEGGHDVTITLVEEGIYDILSTLSVRENGYGKDLESLLLEHVVSAYDESNGKDIQSDQGAMGKLLYEVGLAEKILSENSTAFIKIQPRHNISTFILEITPSKFTELHERYFREEVFPAIEKVFTESKIQKEDIDAIIMTGEPDRVAKVKPFITNMLSDKLVGENVPSDEAFVRGVAKIAKVFSEPFSDIFCCLDVNPLAVGIEVEGGIFEKVIPRNHLIPTRRTVSITTLGNEQKTITLRIFEGERALTRYNKLLGVIGWKGIEAAKPGVFVLEVAFEIDGDRTLKVTMSELGTENVETLVLEGRAQIDYTNVEAVITEAEAKFEEDQFEKMDVMREVMEKQEGGALFDYEELKGVRIQKDCEVLSGGECK